MAGDVKRSVRVSQGVREELAKLLGHDVKDPRAAGVLVSRVEISDDLRSARVYVRLLEGGEDQARRKDALVGLARAASMLRRELTRRLKLRFAPELRFFYDEGQDKLDRIEQLLHEVAKAGKKADRE